MTGREKIAARLRALRAKTVANGCTEEEALAAAEKLAEILALHNMTIDEAELRASPFGRHAERHTDEVGDRLWKVAQGVSVLTGARYWTSCAGSWPVEISFFGFAHEVEIATYLLEVCAGAMRREFKRLNGAYALLMPPARRRKILPFLDGMADRLRTRIIKLKPPAPMGTGLIVLHRSLIDAAMADAGLKTSPLRARPSRDHDASYADGLAAADAVALRAALSARSANGQLGQASSPSSAERGA